MPRQLNTLWFAQSAVDELVRETGRHLPNESGGILLGYWARQPTEAVVTEAVGPGPRAEHRKDGFRPDADYHEAAIAEAYLGSGTRITYLGDWHSHPACSGALSKRDRRTLRHIAEDANSRLPRPFMVIVGRRDRRMEIAAWQGRLTRTERLYVTGVWLRPFQMWSAPER